MSAHVFIIRIWDFIKLDGDDSVRPWSCVDLLQSLESHCSSFYKYLLWRDFIKLELFFVWICPKHKQHHCVGWQDTLHYFAYKWTHGYISVHAKPKNASWSFLYFVTFMKSARSPLGYFCKLAFNKVRIKTDIFGKAGWICTSVSLTRTCRICEMPNLFDAQPVQGLLWTHQNFFSGGLSALLHK